MGKGLSITRRAGESVFIGSDIEVITEKLDNGTVSLRIIAPQDVLIHRDASRVGRRLSLAASIKKGR